MRTLVIDDGWDTRWTVRSHRDRDVPLDADGARRRREPELLARLGPALAPVPQLVPDLVEGPLAQTRRAREDQHSAAVVGGQVIFLGALIPLVIGIWHARHGMRPSRSAFWVVDLRAAGRIRRGATWRVNGPEDGVRVAATVADAVRTGRVPELDDALLLDVVDERLTVYGAPR